MKRNYLVSGYYKILTKIIRTLQWLLGASTVGVRTLVFNSQQEILLIKHTYMDHWHFPGGGVFPGEPARIAAVRELREESGVEALGALDLFGVYFHKVMRVNDYIVLYVVKDFVQNPVILGGEIAEVQWFRLTALPEDISPSTLLRIQEYFYQQKQSDFW